MLYCVLAWILFAALAVNFAVVMTREIGMLTIGETPFLDVFNGFWRAVLVGLPTLLVAFAVQDAARLFGQFSEGDIFSEANVKTLRSCGDTLILAAFASSLISPTLLSWFDGEGRGFLWRLNDLAIASFAMGAVVRGFGAVMRRGGELKAENDEIV